MEVQGFAAAFNADSGTLGKPQLITSADDARLLIEHTVADGESLDAIAARYGVSVDTIKWANNLTRSTVAAGTVLKILPTSGALYKVKAGDTLASLASKYKVTEQRIVLFNDLELTGLQVGEEIILPNAELPTNERPGYVAPVYTARYSYGDYYGGSVRVLGAAEAISKYLPHVSGFTQKSYGNRMTLGQCTWYVWERRLALGKPLPNAVLGNAGQWQASAIGSYIISNIHTSLYRGAIMQRFGNPGHVSIVENVIRDANGRITEILISEMNHVRTYVVSERTIPGSELYRYRFIN